MLDFLIFTAYLAAVILIGYIVVFLGQLVLERFILITLPVIARMLDSFKHPEKYQ